jgi:hypothetical protein
MWGYVLHSGEKQEIEVLDAFDQVECGFLYMGEDIGCLI